MKKQKKISAKYILSRCDLLIKSDCKIIGGVLYEKCRADKKLYKKTMYRFFFSTDDYDYVEDKKMISLLNYIFKKS